MVFKLVTTGCWYFGPTDNGVVEWIRSDSALLKKDQGRDRDSKYSATAIYLPSSFFVMSYLFRTHPKGNNNSTLLLWTKVHTRIGMQLITSIINIQTKGQGTGWNQLLTCLYLYFFKFMKHNMYFTKRFLTSILNLIGGQRTSQFCSSSTILSERMVGRLKRIVTACHRMGEEFFFALRRETSNKICLSAQWKRK